MAHVNYETLCIELASVAAIDDATMAELRKRHTSSAKEPVTVLLHHPIQFGTRVVESLTLRPIKAKDMRRLRASTDRPMAMMLELAGYLSGEVEQVIDELQGEDLQEVLRVVSGFFGGSLATGTGD